MAQIMPDDTLGNEGSLLTEDTEVRGGLAGLVEGGATRGVNLFHSFLEFNVDEGQRVYFANPVGIESILSRVTGENPSNIFGLLGVDGGADLFLLNPNGIVFGEGANFDIEGSFYGTTGDAIGLGEDGVFSAVEPGSSRLLRVNPSVLLGNYLTADSGDIESRGQLVVLGDLVLAGNGLDLQGQVAAGGDLTLLGLEEVRIRDTVEVPFVGFAGGDLLVQGNQRVDIVALNHHDSGLFSYGEMVLRSAERVGGDAHYLSGGSFRVEQLDGTGGELFSPVDPIIRAFGDVDIEQYSGSSLHILAGGSVNIGSAIITSPESDMLGVDFLQENVELSDGTMLEIDGAAQPTLDIRAGVKPEVIGSFPGTFGVDPINDFISTINLTDTPSRADIQISFVGTTAESRDSLVLLTNQYEPNTDLLGGDIQITREGLPAPLQTLPSGFINLANIDVDTVTGELEGQGGRLFVDSRDNIAVLNSFISTQSSGDVGDVVMLADGRVTLDGLDNTNSVGIFTNLVSEGQGTGGNIQIRAENLEILDGFQLASYVDGNGQGGDIVIDIDETIVIEDGTFFSTDISDNPPIITDGMIFIPSQIATGIGVNGNGESGNIQITAERLEVAEGARITSNALGNGQAGNIVLDVREAVLLKGSDSAQQFLGGISSDVLNTDGNAQGGNIYITAGSLESSNGADISTTTFGIGDAGDIELRIRETARFEGANPVLGTPSGIASDVQSDAEGQAGDIYIIARNVEVLNGAELNASTFGKGDAGNIILEIEETVRFDGVNPVDPSRVSLAVSSVQIGGMGQGGNVQISATNLEVLNSAQLSTSVFGIGDAGDIILDTQDMVRIDGADPANGVGSLIVSGVAFDGQGNGGDIRLAAADLEILNGGQLLASTRGLGDAGNVILDIRNIVRFEGINAFNTNATSAAFSSVEETGEGQGGDIRITADGLEVLSGAQIISATSGLGDAGSININTRESVRFEGVDPRDNAPSGAFSNTDNSGEGGNIQITTGILRILDGAQFSSTTNGSDDAGNIIIAADELNVVRAGGLLTTTNGSGSAGDIILDINRTAQFAGVSPVDGTSSGLSSNVGETGTGKGGDIIVTAGNLQLLDGTKFNAGTFGLGDSGNVIVTVRETAQLEGSDPRDDTPSGIFSTIEVGAEGQGGDIQVTAQNLEVLNGAQLSSGVAGTGNGGDIVLTIVESARFNGEDDTGALTTIQESGIGQGGDVRLSAANLFIENGAVIAAGSLGQGDSGNVVIEVRDLIQARDGDISTRAELNAGGQLQISAGNIVLLGDSDIRSFVNSGMDNGGNITIIANALVALDDSDILAFAADGRGGDIDLSQTVLFSQNLSPTEEGLSREELLVLDGNGQVDINATGGIASGEIIINDASFVENSLNELSDEFVDTATLTAGSCIARADDENTGSFVVTGGEGLPQRPGTVPLASYSTDDIQSPMGSTVTSNIQEAHGVYQLADGRLVLSHRCGG
ncbi:filamentous hemagglutinin N-terminal domain-containing protein [Leptolyngbyaceae cyanobacterium CCMR0081]|uniref:Filamentous hemagglutinin N-terminal domain-containing protein n=2 Tax=Adonisia TaxID=2950183 RepID=A0A6M0RWI8_9CYAN|nr:filamentous hemagglutinin N-terminal domain-containing protein [Adonisia turfae CCMR0081]